jgi:hypothetical protein
VKFQKCATLLLVAALMVVSVKKSKAANIPPPPVVVISSSVGAGVWISGTIIGVAALLGIYDITRRNSCVGDFLNLGGPGFDRTITPNDTVLKPPACTGTNKKRNQSAPRRGHLQSEDEVGEMRSQQRDPIGPIKILPPKGTAPVVFPPRWPPLSR